MRAALRRVAWWLLEITTPKDHRCSMNGWHSKGAVTLRIGDAHETHDEFGPTLRLEVLDIRHDEVTMNQLVRCPAMRSAAMDEYLRRKHR